MKRFFTLLFSFIVLQGCAPALYQPATTDTMSKLKGSKLIIATKKAPSFSVKGSQVGQSIGFALGGILGGVIAAASQSAELKKGEPFQSLVTDPTEALNSELARSISDRYKLNYDGASPKIIKNVHISKNITKSNDNALLLQVDNIGWELIRAKDYLVLNGTYKPQDDAEKKTAKENKGKVVVRYETRAALYRLSNGHKKLISKGTCSNIANQMGNYRTLESLQKSNGALLQQELDTTAQLCVKCYQNILFGMNIALQPGETCTEKRTVYMPKED